MALPMFMISQPILATDYVTTFASVSTDFGLLKDVTGSQEAAWSYTATSGVSGPYYSEGGMSGLSFTLPINSNSTDTEVNSQIDDQQEDADLVRQLEGYGLGLTSLGQNLQESLSMTSCRSFSGLLQTIKVSCQYIDGLEIQAYYMEHGDEILLGTLWYNQNTQSYTYSNLKTVDVLDGNNIKLVFSVNVNYSSNYNSLQVYGLSGVTVSVNEPLVPQTNGQIVTFDPSVFGSADLTNFQYNGILFTLNMSSDGDGFEVEDGEGVIYLATTNTDTNVEYLAEWVEDNTYIPGSESYALEFFGGITLKVPAGSGYLRIDAQTEGNYVLHVRIGNKRVVEISNTSRRISEIPYKVDKETYVYVYLTQTASGSRGTRIGKRSTAHGKIYSFCSSTAPETTSVTVPISSAGQAIVCSDYDLDYSSVASVKAYVVTGYDKKNGKIWLSRVFDVPAETAVLLMGAAGSYSIPVASESKHIYQNMLVGSLDGTTVKKDNGDGYTNYILSKVGDEVGFYFAKETGSTIKAGGGYLPLPTTIAATGTAGSKVTISMNKYGMKSYCPSQSLDFSSLSDLKAYTATGYSKSGIISLTRVKKVPAGVGILLLAPAEKKDYKVPTASLQQCFANMFKGTLEGTTITQIEDGMVNYYVSVVGDVVGYYLASTSGTKISANGSWLPVPKSMTTFAARGMNDEVSVLSETLDVSLTDDVIYLNVYGSIEGDDNNLTGIKSIDSSERVEDSDAWYNLNGQRVASPAKKGLYIHNGKKVFIR